LREPCVILFGRRSLRFSIAVHACLTTMKSDDSNRKPVDPKRSYNMSRIRSADTKPEMVVRSLIHRLGYRFRLHRKDLPGRPDIVLPRHRKIILVHGCFWHSHGCGVGGSGPKSNRNYWQPKLERNLARDMENQKKLTDQGWKILVIWECRTRDNVGLKEKLIEFLRS
jgi:DNA mismatch endonuclease (patch repair protein)